jgi:alpha-ketoglutarate-dependent taurine dioxygenase
MLNCLRHDINRLGWAELNASGDGETFSAFLLQLGNSLGHPVPMRRTQAIEELSPRDSQDAKSNSLSRIHGLGAFPLHTDYAHWIVPPRFIILGCASPGSSEAPTLIRAFHDIQLNEKELELCKVATFVVRNGRQSFYSTILEQSGLFIRFDQGCMKPVSDEASEASEIMLSRLAAAEPAAVNWQLGKVLIIDNWRALHGRGVAVSSSVSSDRRIFRMCIQ